MASRPHPFAELIDLAVTPDGKGGTNLGGSAAQSVILLAMVIAMTAFQFRFIERKVNY